MRIVIAKDMKCGVIGYFSINKSLDVEAGDIITTKYIKTDGSETTSFAMCISDAFDIDENGLRFFNIDKALAKNGIATGSYKFVEVESVV